MATGATIQVHGQNPVPFTGEACCAALIDHGLVVLRNVEGNMIGHVSQSQDSSFHFLLIPLIAPFSNQRCSS